MGVTVRWLDNEEHILAYEFVGQWTVSDALAVFRQGYDISEHCPGFSIIFDLRQTRHVPSDILILHNPLLHMRQDNVNVRVFVGVTGMIRAFMQVINRLTPQLLDGVVSVDTLDEALALIDERVREAE